MTNPGLKNTGRRIRTGSSNDALVEERRLQIIKCATLVFVEKGYEKSKMADIARECRMSYGAAYHYVGSKEDVLFLIVNYANTSSDRLIETVREKIQDLPPREALATSIREYLQYVDALQDTLIVINHTWIDLTPEDRKTVYAAQERALGFFESVIHQGVRSGDFVVTDPLLMANNVVTLAQQWAHRRWFLRKRYTFAQYCDRLNETFFKEVGIHHEMQPAHIT